MKKIILLILIVLASAAKQSFAQKDTVFFDKDWKECKRSNAAFFRIIIRREKDYLVKDMYISGHPQMIAECSSLQPQLVREGQCSFYNESGIIFSQGNYHNDIECGLWRYIKNKGKDTSYFYQGVTVTPDSIYHDRLYVGIDNPVRISVCNIPNEKLRVTTSTGSIEGKNGNYIVRIQNAEVNDTFKIFEENKFLTKIWLRCLKIPIPEAYIGNAHSDCSPSREDILKAGCLTAKTTGYDVESKYRVVSFNMSFLQYGLYLDLASNGPCLTEKMKEIIKDRTKGKRILIEEVWAIGPDSVKKKISGIQIRFDLDDTKAELTTEQMKSKVQQLENIKITQEKLMLAQANKLNEAEITKEKALASAKENELAMVKQEQQMNEMKAEQLETKRKADEEKKEAAHKAELKQRAIVLYSVLAGLLIVLVFAGFVFRSLRIRNKQNKIIVAQKEVVEEKQREILDSIEYALRIQTAILPPTRIVKQYLENSFILYKPKDIVAGDFYWMETINDLVLFAACDCTGHGVPGAMVSVVCHNALNRAVREFGLTEPAKILDKTAEIVIENFSKSEEDIKDGMDISLVSLKYSSQNSKIEIEWAGANNPLWIVKRVESGEWKADSNSQFSTLNYQLIETKADKQPIGMNEDSKPFTNHTFTLNSGDTIYLFTDGFADQFGGDTGEKKLTRKRFKELLLSIQNKPLAEQCIASDNFIVDYRKQVEQIDDILVMGVRV